MAAVGIPAAVVGGCGDRGEEPPRSGREAAAPEAGRRVGGEPPDPAGGVPLALGDGVEALLRLAERLPPGTTLARARQRLPALGAAGPEGGLEPAADDPLSEARVPVEALGRRGHAELNFRHDTLYSLYVALDSLPCPGADSLYAGLRRGLSGPLGEPLEEEGSEPGYRSRTSFWSPETRGASTDAEAAVADEGGAAEHPSGEAPAAEARAAGARPAAAFVATLGIQDGVCRLGWGYQEARLP